MNRITVFFVLLGLVWSHNINCQTELRSYKGQLHCHSTESDGAIHPDSVAALYKADGYDFLTLSDHWKATNISHHNSPDFLTFGANEISPKRDHIHAIGMSYSFTSDASDLQEGIDHTLAAGGLAMINHPQWSKHPLEKVLATSGAAFLEVLNADDNSHLVDLEIWDGYLSEDRQIYGVGTDDAHKYDANSSHYNECWVEVFATELSEKELLKSMLSGDFTSVDRGQEKSDDRVSICRVDQHLRTLTVVSDAPLIRFIGKDGILLLEVKDSVASYTLPEDELYVRAVATNGIQAAYTQAYFPQKYDASAGTITATQNMGRDILANTVYINFIPNKREAIAETQLFANNAPIATLEASATSFTWEDAPAGKHLIKARFDVDGKYYWSNAVEIQIGE